MKSYGKKSSYQNSPSPVEPIDHVILRLKLFDALIDISKFLFDWIKKRKYVEVNKICQNVLNIYLLHITEYSLLIVSCFSF